VAGTRLGSGGLGARLAAALSAWLMVRWQGPRPGLAARLLQPLSWLYAVLADGHAALYRIGLLRAASAPVPLLVVGNLVAGGAGKTPAVIALVNLLRGQGWTPGVISRGHGRQGSAVLAVTRGSRAAEVGDEPLLIHLRTDAPVRVGAGRVAAARALCADHPEVDILLADDGLQHHRLHHDMALLVFDDRGVGNGLRLPAGPLRQALPAAVPPHSLVLYNAERPSTALPGLTGSRRLTGVLPLRAWWQGQATDRKTDADADADGGWAALRGRPLLGAAGLARPEAFFKMLEAQGLRITRLPLSDHHGFDSLPWPAGTADVIVTEKDAVKLPPDSVGATRVWVATLDFQPEPAFDAALRMLCAPFRPPP
jgi:tetraacyldisaccharide 4'-kinase